MIRARSLTLIPSGGTKTNTLECAEVLAITEEGKARWQALRRQVEATSQELLSPLGHAGLAAAVRVLQAVTSQAPGILARWQKTSGP
jgi:DNA-binding MarR family transcriptional regulator